MFWIKNSTSSTFSQTINNPYVPKKNYGVFELTKLKQKKTKTWPAKVAAIFTHRTSLLHRICVLGFFNSKIKKCIFLVPILHLVFFFNFQYACLNYLPLLHLFCIIKNSRNNVRCTTGVEKSKNVKWGIIPYYLFV